MHVLLLTHEFPPNIFGGIGIFCYELAKALGKSGVNVTVVAGCPPRTIRASTDTVEVGTNVRVVRVPRLDFPPSHLWYQLMNTHTFKEILSDAEIVHGQDFSAFPTIHSSKKTNPRLPWVVTLHSGPVSELHCVLGSIGRGGSIGDMIRYGAGFPAWDLAMRGDIRLADVLVPVSESLSMELRSCYAMETRKVSVIHTGVDTRGLHETARNGHSNWMTSRKVKMFWAGRLVWRKGIVQLINSLEYLAQRIGFRDFELQIFGRGPLEHGARRLILRSNLKDNVILRGFVEYKELIASMASSDIVCFPSLYEACPVTMIEAMALGKPVAAFDKSFSRELLGGDPKLPLT